jgi:hypothetical protein
MSFWKKVFGSEKSGGADAPARRGGNQHSDGDPCRGEIKFALLVASLPEEPSMPHMCEFVQKSLPELKNPNAKIGFVWKTDPIESIDASALAVNTFGSEVADPNRYTYRTISFKLPNGHAKVLVIYQKR